ncbi:hypothetical protein P7K49_017965 [Saguinus oedipus]|uniref:Uncharacterized protein n=1 Tax=Saguinus oedipus TaxID=9490 RepID=A0ABQ9V555_SAGOE|nr:hypothetical protein P7K49_017965 [Saguinus oedipus]
MLAPQLAGLEDPMEIQVVTASADELLKAGANGQDLVIVYIEEHPSTEELAMDYFMAVGEEAFAWRRGET